jgi:hypothetical protein
LVISNRFPGWQAVTSVYAMIVLLVYGWTIYWITWKFPSWIYYLTILEILWMICYAMVVNLLESLLFMIGILVLGILVPRAWLADRFAASGSLLSILIAGILMYFSAPIQLEEKFSYTPLIQMGISFLIASGIAMLLPLYPPIAAFLDLLADRAKIFLYILLPVSLLSLVIVIVRNLVS